MIGQPYDVCDYMVCDRTDTRVYAEDFGYMEVRKGVAALSTKRASVRLCKRHVDKIVAQRHQGFSVAISPEGWVYVNDWTWLFYELS